MPRVTIEAEGSLDLDAEDVVEYLKENRDVIESKAKGEERRVYDVAASMLAADIVKPDIGGQVRSYGVTTEVVSEK